MSPESARIRVDRIRTIVVLPAPLGPSKAKIVLLATVRSTSSSTSWSPYDLRTLTALMAEPALVVMVISPRFSDSVRRRVAHRPCGALRDALSIPVRAAEVARPRSRRTPHTPTAPRDVLATHRPGLRDLHAPARLAPCIRTRRSQTLVR